MRAFVAGLQRHGMSLSKIAEQSGVSRSTIYRAINGEARQPSHDCYAKLDTLAKSFGPPPPPGKIVRR